MPNFSLPHVTRFPVSLLPLPTVLRFLAAPSRATLHCSLGKVGILHRLISFPLIQSHIWSHELTWQDRVGSCSFVY